MAIVINQDAYDKIYDYVILSERDPKEKNPFSVQLKLINSRNLAKLDDGLTKINDDQTVTLCSGSYNFNLLKRSLYGWKNLNDENGNEVPLIKNADGTVKDESISSLPLFIINELADLVATASRNPDSVEALFEIPSATKNK